MLFLANMASKMSHDTHLAVQKEAEGLLDELVQGGAK
jgi:hypothetical protein